MHQETKVHDVIISGGGLVGSLLAITLDHYGFSTLMLDRRDWSKIETGSYDGRASAIANDCWRLLSLMGVENSLLASSQEIMGMKISESLPDQEKAAFSLHFDHKQSRDECLGRMVENEHFRLALNKRLSLCKNVVRCPDSEIIDYNTDTSKVCCDLSTGQKIKGRVLVSTEGRYSQLRNKSGIQASFWNYDQKGLVCTISHEKPHLGFAFQRFLPTGPFAVLPLQGTDVELNRSSVVWTEKSAVADAVMALDEEAFSIQMERRFGFELGRLKLLSKRWSYPLVAMTVKNIVADRVALLGDSAHAVHPLAGQGLNLGIRDVAAFVEVVVEARRLGLDFGGPQTLADYQRWRRFDTTLSLAVSDSLNKLFQNPFMPLGWLRRSGLSVVNHFDPLKTRLVNMAGGASENQPRLLAGYEI